MIRTDLFDASLLPDLINTLSFFLQSSFTVDSIRILATYIVSTLPKGSAGRNAYIDERDAPALAGKVPTRTIMTNAKESRSTNFKNVKLRNMLLEMLYGLMTDPNPSYLNTFAQTITSKWMLLFLDDVLNEYTIVLALRMLVRLLSTQGSAYMNKFVDLRVAFWR